MWRLATGAPRCERSTDRLTVRLRGDAVGQIDLAEVFGREG